MPARAAISTPPDSTKPEVAKPEKKAASTMKSKSAPAPAHTASEAANEERAAKTQAPTAVQPVEPEDAYLTGVSRSLQRRLLGLNVEGARPQAKPVPEATSAGLHSTGSFTESQSTRNGTTKVTKNGQKK